LEASPVEGQSLPQKDEKKKGEKKKRLKNKKSKDIGDFLI